MRFLSRAWTTCWAHVPGRRHRPVSLLSLGFFNFSRLFKTTSGPPLGLLFFSYGGLVLQREEEPQELLLPEILTSYFSLILSILKFSKCTLRRAFSGAVSTSFAIPQKWCLVFSNFLIFPKSILFSLYRSFSLFLSPNLMPLPIGARCPARNALSSFMSVLRARRHKHACFRRPHHDVRLVL